MLTKETEALRNNEGKIKFTYIDFRMFEDMYKYFDNISSISTQSECIKEILNTLSAIIFSDNIIISAKLLPKLQSLGYRLSLYLINEPFYNSSIYNLKGFESMAKVLDFGAKRYSKNNWRKGYVDKFSAADSLLRHLRQIIIGEVNDMESGLPHIGHLMCNIMFLTNDLLYVKRD